MTELSGQCLCGAVKFNATAEREEMGVCHCAMCRRWTGGVFMAVTCKRVNVEDKSELGVFVSSDWGERCFCKKCGSTLFWRMRDESHNAVSIQAFDNPEAFAFTSEIFIDEKPSSYEFANKTKKMTGQEVIAAFAGGQEN
ncbi:MAG: GFA family protein [Parvularculaceae bacterium]